MLEDMRALGFALVLCGPPLVFAQHEPVRELLTPVDAQKRVDLMSRYAIEIAEWEYFAKPGTLGIYEFDIEVLDSLGRISITPAGSLPIEFVSHGLERNPRWGGSLMVWHGELISGSTKRGSPVELNVAVQSVDAAGNVRLPDPNREVTLRALQEESYTVLKESYDRRNERLVYSLAGNFLTVPDRKTTYTFQLLDEQFSAVVFYEIDRGKTISLPDVVVTEAGDQREELEADPEQMRRLEAYEAYMKGVRQRIATEQNRE